jgi:flagellin
MVCHCISRHGPHFELFQRALSRSYSIPPAAPTRRVPVRSTVVSSITTVGVRGADHQFQRNYQKNVERTQQSVERLSTGKRINRPSDDPAGFVAAEQLRGEIADLKRRISSIGHERVASHTRQSELNNIQDALLDLQGRVLEATDGFLTAEQRAAFEDEIDAAADAIEMIVARSSHATPGAVKQVAAELRQDTPTPESIAAYADSLLSEEVSLAAYEHTHLDKFEALYQDQIVITTETLSMIEDTDFAAETANLAQSKILAQGAMAALSYYNHQRADQLLGLLDEIV